VRGLLEALMREERAMYLETHFTSANGFYARDLLTLAGPVGDFKVPTKSVRRYFYTTNQLERLAKEIKRRTKVVEVFCGEGVVEKLLYLVLHQLNEAWGARRVRGFAEIQIGNYHVALTH
jgi:hypothetical protein